MASGHDQDRHVGKPRLFTACSTARATKACGSCRRLSRDAAAEALRGRKSRCHRPPPHSTAKTLRCRKCRDGCMLVLVSSRIAIVAKAPAGSVMLSSTLTHGASPETADTEDPSRVKSLPFLTAMDADALGAPRASPSLAPTLAPAGEEGAA